MVLAFLPQHVWEVGASVLAVLLIGQGLSWLIRGSSVARARGITERTVRSSGGFGVLVGVGVGIAAFTIDAEQPGAQSGDGWGGTAGIVILCVWVALMCAGPVSKLIKAKPGSRDGSRS